MFIHIHGSCSASASESCSCLSLSQFLSLFSVLDSWLCQLGVPTRLLLLFTTSCNAQKFPHDLCISSQSIIGTQHSLILHAKHISSHTSHPVAPRSLIPNHPPDILSSVAAIFHRSPRPLHQVPSHHADMLNNKDTMSSAYGLYPQLSNQHPLTCIAKSSSEVRESAKFRLLITGTTQ